MGSCSQGRTIAERGEREQKVTHVSQRFTMSTLFDNSYNPGFQQQQQQQGYYQQPPETPLQFYQGDASYGYSGARPSLEGNVVTGNGMSSVTPGFGGNMQSVGPWWTAFGTGGFEGEPPLMEGMCPFTSTTAATPLNCSAELGINFGHIGSKSLTVLNPLKSIDEHIMDDADLAGPFFFCFCFALFLLFVSRSLASILSGMLAMYSNHLLFVICSLANFSLGTSTASLYSVQYPYTPSST